MVWLVWELFLGKALPAAPAGIACAALALSASWLHLCRLKGRSGIQVHCPKNSRLRVPKTGAKQLGASRLFGQVLPVSSTFGVFINCSLIFRLFSSEVRDQVAHVLLPCFEEGTARSGAKKAPGTGAQRAGGFVP